MIIFRFSKILKRKWCIQQFQRIKASPCLMLANDSQLPSCYNSQEWIFQEFSCSLTSDRIYCHIRPMGSGQDFYSLFLSCANYFSFIKISSPFSWSFFTYFSYHFFSLLLALFFLSSNPAIQTFVLYSPIFSNFVLCRNAISQYMFLFFFNLFILCHLFLSLKHIFFLFIIFSIFWNKIFCLCLSFFLNYTSLISSSILPKSCFLFLSLFFFLCLFFYITFYPLWHFKTINN